MVGVDLNPYIKEWTLRKLELEDSLQQGEFRPLLLHHLLCLLGPLFLSLLISRQETSLAPCLRYLAFAWTVIFGTWIMQTCRAASIGNGMFIGTAVAFSIMRAATLLIFRDPEIEFRRLEKRYITKDSVKSTGANSSAEPPQAVLIWQDYPPTFGHRLSWVLHLITSPRGSLWNWRVRSSGPIPKILREQMLKRRPKPIPVESVAPDNISGCTQNRFWYFLGVYLRSQLCINLITMLGAQDPYYLGHIDADWQVPFLSHAWSFSASSSILRAYRLILVIWTARVWSIYIHSLVCALLLAFSVVFPSATHCLLLVPMNERWMLPDPTGPFSSIYESGLIGFWGKYWHQYLRFDFLQWSTWIVSLFAAKRQTLVLQSVIYTTVPFIVSGVLHACGSYTQFADTKPVGMIISSFLMAGVGVGVQRIWLAVILPKALPGGNPPWLGKATNFVFAVLWNYLAGIPFGDDLARGGMFADFIIDFRHRGFVSFEMSNQRPFQLWKGKTWWESGIRFR